MTLQQEFNSWLTLSPTHVQIPPEINSKAPSSSKLTFPDPNGKPSILAFLRHCGCPVSYNQFLLLLALPMERSPTPQSGSRNDYIYLPPSLQKRPSLPSTPLPPHTRTSTSSPSRTLPNLPPPPGFNPSAPPSPQIYRSSSMPSAKSTHNGDWEPVPPGTC